MLNQTVLRVTSSYIYKIGSGYTLEQHQAVEIVRIVWISLSTKSPPIKSFMGLFLNIEATDVLRKFCTIKKTSENLLSLTKKVLVCIFLMQNKGLLGVCTSPAQLPSPPPALPLLLPSPPPALPLILPSHALPGREGTKG